MFHIKQSEQNQMSMSSVASSMVSISSSSEEQNGDLVNGVSGKCHGSTKNGSGKNRSGSATSDNERCECYHNNKKRRSAKVSRCFGNAYLCMPPNLLCFKVWFVFIIFFYVVCRYFSKGLGSSLVFEIWFDILFCAFLLSCV